MIYLDTQVANLDLDKALGTVGEQRRQHALHYKREHDQRLSVAAYHLLQHALSMEYGIKEPPSFAFEAHGKPMLVDHPNIFFNLSHCHEAAACVVDTIPVGIDVESLSSYDADIVTTVMNDDEQRKIANSPDPRLTFIQLWTMKESLLKMTGEGMTDDIRHILDKATPNRHPFRFLTTVYPKFVCTVCYGEGTFG